jgi:hypothetical protein
MLTARVHDPDAAARVADRLTTVDPNMGQVVTMKTVAGLATYFLQLAFCDGHSRSAGLVLTLSDCSACCRSSGRAARNEIGVRMALATAAAVGRLVLAETVRPVGLGLGVGVAGAVAVATALLASPAASSIAAFIRVLDPVAYAGGAVVILMACAVAAIIPTLQATRIEPITILRQE